ncbi:Acyl-[acyl-carrier-protein]--UDP-N-acetylglucosamine O-acyltransferase [hydrothermal vent metagenome]|uniref:Acyl-[acyl-carrier-protein]--UDP-N-acetylglucosamine O-acyltransferase n=1 Tax=hydrothermal vent metagenome TaxID=652676 RepID=A0A3B0ZEA7_9ZZZZ
MIHSSAIIDPAARLAEDVTVGPFSTIGADVEIGRGSVIGSHVVVKGPTTIGENNQIFQFASVGEDPQDKKYQGEVTRLEIGDNNVIREGCTLNRGTAQDRGMTSIGDGNLIMAYVHIAHDCVVKNNTILANNVALAGHVTIEDFAILGGYTLVHQFCVIGSYAFTAMGSVLPKDVPPYVLVSGHMAKPFGLNIEGLKRRGFSSETIRDLRRAYKLIYKAGITIEQASQQMRDLNPASDEIAVLADFIQKSQRGIVR